jgi:hypothetical protein
MIDESDFGMEDVIYYLKERPDTDFLRLMTTYKTLQKVAKNGKAENGKINTGLSISEFIRLTGLSRKIGRPRLKDLEELGIVKQDYSSTVSKVYYIPNSPNIPQLDKYLEKAEEMFGEIEIGLSKG